MEALTPCPPWLVKDCAAVLGRAEQGSLPHALLITGIEGIGKQQFAQALAESLLCEKKRPEGACGQCDSCAQLIADAHPEYRKLVPEGANASIKVDSVRELVTWLQLTAAQGSYRVALLEQADSLNRNAANSLLKTLEEPGDNAVLILVASRPGSLPATVQSRCQTITLRMHDKAAAIEWLTPQISSPADALAACQGGPYTCIAQSQAEFQATSKLLLKAWTDLFMHKGSVGRISDSVADLPTRECLAAFGRFTLLAAKARAGVSVGVDPAVQEAILAVKDRLQNEQWFTLHDRLLKLHRSDSASFKTQTVLEGLLADIRIMIRD